MGVPVEITPRRQGLQLKCESAYPKFPLQKSLIQTSGCRPGGQWTKTCLISSSSTHIPSCGWQASAVSAKDHTGRHFYLRPEGGMKRLMAIPGGEFTETCQKVPGPRTRSINQGLES